MPTLLRSSHPTAKKSHRCYTCRESIEPGTPYAREVYLGDDGLYEWLSCDPCKDILGDVYAWAGSPYEGVLEEDFDEWAHLHVDDEKVGEHARAFLVRRGCKCDPCDLAMGGGL